MTYTEFLTLVSDTFTQESRVRFGQHYFNALSEHAPEIASRIRGTKADPFYYETIPSETEQEVRGSWG